jgi:hypothetical protein
MVFKIESNLDGDPSDMKAIAPEMVFRSRPPVDKVWITFGLLARETANSEETGLPVLRLGAWASRENPPNLG